MTMAHLDLEKGKELPINLAAGSIISFKSGIFDLTPGGNHETHLDFFNGNDDMILRISLRRGRNRVFFNDRAQKSLVDGWGQERSVRLRPTDVDRWRCSGVLISVHDCSTPSSDQYQILFGLTIVHYFNRRFPGPAVKVAYEEVLPSGKELFFNRRCSPQLSDPLETSSCTLDDLPASERAAIESGRVLLPPLGISISRPQFSPGRPWAHPSWHDLPSATIESRRVPLAIFVPAPREIYISPPQFRPGRPWAHLSWDNGKEMRIYGLGPGNILNDYIYSARRNEWDLGNLRDLGIVLDPASNLATMGPWSSAVEISVYYQDPITNTIYEIGSSCSLLNPQGYTARQSPGWPVATAVKGSSIVTLHLNTPHVFYQDPWLCLRESIYNPSSNNYVFGEFKTGPQPHGTPITAEVVHGGNVGANVMWKDANGLPMRSTWSRSSGWDVPIRVNPRIRLLDGQG